MKKLIFTTIIILLLAAIGGGVYYWYFYIQNPDIVDIPTNNTTPATFSPFNNTSAPVVTEPVVTAPVSQSTTTIVVDNVEVYKVPKLRQISQMPISGFFASSTASTSIVRFMDRGTGHIYEASNASSGVVKISNTTLPKIYEAYGNKNGNSYIIRYLRDETDVVSNFYTELRSTGTSTSQTPYELKGKYLSPDVRQVAVSPTGDRVFTWNVEGAGGVGYISSFDEKTKTKIYTSPLTKVNVDWPTPTTLTISTKATALASGHMYSIDTRTGESKTLVGGFRGLTGKLSKDGTRVLYSYSTNDGFNTRILNIRSATTTNVIFKTLSEKCTWSELRKNEIYCAVPTLIADATYPDDWYTSKTAFIDQIWHLDTTTGEAHQLANILNLTEKLVDATNLTLDPKENTLYFINKNDLALWALDLNQ
jgi:hypothetical protein